MQDNFKYEKGYWYPHMKPRDIEIWERFIDAYPTAYDLCQYDFGIGDLPAFIKDASSKEGQAMQELYRLKIDVLGWTAGHIDLIEVKPNAGASAIGQVLGYVQLYKRDVVQSVPVYPVIVTNEEKLNMRFLCEQNGVRLVVV